MTDEDMSAGRANVIARRATRIAKVDIEEQSPRVLFISKRFSE